MHIELAVHAMESAGHVDEMILFSGDGDFRPLVEAVQRRGVRVTVVSSIASQPPMIADELRRQADAFTDLMPAALSPLDQTLRKDFNTRQAGRQPRGALRSLPPARS
jgi:uncharacterized LabA/DUF88 family protein